MFQRLIIPLALRSLLLSIVIASIVCIFIAPVRLLRGEQTTTATLREFSAGVSWSGHAIASNKSFNPASCTKAQTCDLFTLRVDVSEQYRQLHPNFALSLRLSWDDPQNDFDLYISKDGRTIDDSTQGQTNTEEARVDRPENGIYHIFTHAAAAAPSTPYTGQAKIIGAALNPAQRSARYMKDPDGKYGPQMFRFSPASQLDKSQNAAGMRTSIAIDAFGNTYVSNDGSTMAVSEPEFTIGRLQVERTPQWAVAEGASQGNFVANGTGTLYNVFGGPTRDDIYLAKCGRVCE